MRKIEHASPLPFVIPEGEFRRLLEPYIRFGRSLEEALLPSKVGPGSTSQEEVEQADMTHIIQSPKPRKQGATFADVPAPDSGEPKRVQTTPFRADREPSEEFQQMWEKMKRGHADNGGGAPEPAKDRLRLVKVPPELYDGSKSTFFDATEAGMRQLGYTLAKWLVEGEPSHGDTISIELVEMTREEFDAIPEV